MMWLTYAKKLIDSLLSIWYKTITEKLLKTRKLFLE